MKQVLATAVVAAFIAMPALAQERGRGEGFGQGRMQQLSAEELTAAWKLEAQSVADEINLDDEVAEQLTTAYVEAREKHAEALRAVREEMMEQFRRAREEGGAGGEGGEGGGEGGEGGETGGRGGRGGGGGSEAFAQMRERMESINTEHRGKLEESLKSVLDEENYKVAIIPLGSFNEQWDRMTHAIAGFELDEMTEAVALGAVLEYVTTTTKARQEATDAEDTENRESMREAMTAAREALRTELASVLSEEQVAQFNRTLGGRRGGGSGGGGIGR